MKRDMNLIRELLLAIEAGNANDVQHKHGKDEVLYHAGLAYQAGLINGVPLHGSQGELVDMHIQGLTWTGHDFIDAARNDSVWQKATSTVKDKGGAWTFDTLRALLTRLVTEALLG